jgi:hypothetical protein
MAVVEETLSSPHSKFSHVPAPVPVLPCQQGVVLFGGELVLLLYLPTPDVRGELCG